MKKLRKYILLFVTVLAIMFTAACGSGTTINTELKINDDLSGERDMQMVFSSSTFESYFTGTIEDLNATISEKIPSSMTFDYAESDGTYYYVFRLAFDSPEDYLQKVNDITGTEHNLTLSSPDGLWVNGFYVDEDFTSTDLLQWFSDALVEKGHVSSGNIGSLFGDGDTKVSYSGNSFSTGKRINVDKIEYLSISHVDVLTEICDIDSFNREVNFYIPEASMNAKGTEISDYMSSVVPSFAKLDKEEVDGTTKFSIKGNSLDIKKLDEFMKAVFGDETSCRDSEYAGDPSPFAFSQGFVDEISLANYVMGNTSTALNTFVKISDDRIVNTSDNYLYYVGNYANLYSDSDYRITVYAEYYGNSTPVQSANSFIKSYYAKSADVTLKSKAGGKWNRSIEISLRDMPTEAEQTAILEKINSLIDKDAAAVSDTEEEAEDKKAKDKKASKGTTTVKADTKDGYKVVIEQEGKMNDILKGSIALFGVANDMQYTVKSGAASVTKKSAVYDYLNMRDFVLYDAGDFKLTYDVKVGSSKVIYSNLPKERYTLEKGTFTCRGDSPVIEVELVTASTNWFAIIMWVALTVSLILICVIIVKAVLAHKKDKAPAAGNRFCTKCGTMIPAGTQFCSNCGNKVE